MSIDEMIEKLKEIKKEYADESFTLIPMSFEILVQKDGDEYCFEKYEETFFGEE